VTMPLSGMVCCP